jgi:hypothetical protein
MRFLRALALVALLAPAARVDAQKLDLSLGLGTLIPQGTLAENSKSGFVGIAGLGLPLGDRFGLRLEALWANSDLDGALLPSAPGGITFPANGEISGDVRLVGGLASLTVDLGKAFLRPYVLGGAGYYQRSVSQTATDAFEQISRLDRDESVVGFHGGIGLRTSLLGVTVFGEARYHTVNTGESKTNFAPLLIGVRF